MARFISLMLLLTAALVLGLVYRGGRTDPGEGVRETGLVAESISGTVSQRSRLLDRLFSEKKILIVYGASDDRYSSAYRELAQNAVLPFRRGFEVSSRPDIEIDWKDLRNTSVLLLGTPASNRILNQLLDRLPLEFDGEGFHFQGQWYRDLRDRLFFFHPNPLDPEYPAYVLTANSDEAVLSDPERPLGRGFDYRISRGTHRLLLGFFSEREGEEWQPDPEMRWDFQQGFRKVAEEEHYRVLAFDSGSDWTESSFKDQLRHREDRLSKVIEFFGTGPEGIPGKITYFLYPSLEAKALQTGDMSLAQAIPAGLEIHVAVEPGISGEGLAPEVGLVSALDPAAPSRDVLKRGLEIYFSRGWGGKGYQYWAARLFLSGIWIPLNRLLDDSSPLVESPLVQEPVAGSLVAFLIEKWGREEFLKRYRHWNPSEGEVSRLEQEWLIFLERLAGKSAARFEKERGRFRKDDEFLRGFSFTHEGYSVFNGYGSKEADRSLARLAAMGVNSVSIIPYGFLRHSDRPAPIGVSWGSQGSENDEATLHAALQARRLGMKVLLKPQIWVGGSWPGSIEMKSEEEWLEFFAHYERWIRHYALMAEMHELDMFCVGVELSRATLGHERQWREMVARLRRIYSGPIVYAANWGEEFEQLDFWDAFDYIGVNSYYPLSSKEAPSLEDLREGARKVVAQLESVQRRFRKPLLITEIGFTAAPDPWREPHQDHRGDEIFSERQADCYRAVFDALEGKTWCRGIFWWKWPSWMNIGRSRAGGFIPLKPAAQVVAERYTEMKSRAERLRSAAP